MLPHAMKTIVLTLTATNRLARVLKERTLESCQVADVSHIMPLKEWIELTWAYLATLDHQLPTLMPAQQSQCLWRDYADELMADYIGRSGIANEAYQAWQLLQQWMLDIGQLNPWCHQADVAFFKRCAVAYERFLAESQAIDDSQCLSVLCAHLTRLNLPNCISFQGFTELTPQLEMLIGQLQMLGVDVNMLTKQALTDDVNVIACDSEFDEYQHAFERARAFLRQCPSKRFIIVVPQLQQQREKLSRLSAHYFPGGGVEISGGVELTVQPLVADALTILSASYLKDAHRLLALLRSPFIRLARQYQATRDQQDLMLRDHIAANAGLDDLRPYLTDPTLAEILDDERLTIVAEKLSIHEHVKKMLDLLTAWGWPGDYALKRNEQQIIARFYHEIEGLLAFDELKSSWCWHEVMALLSQKLAAVVFQQKAQGRTQLKVLGFLEVGGIDADVIYLCGCSDMQLPATAKLNTFIPQQIQRQYNMPHSSCEREYQFAVQSLHMLRQQASVVYLSYARQVSGLKARKSPLLADFVEQPYQGEVLNRVGGPLEPIVEYPAPIVAEEATLAGGAAVLKSQALCPFQSFARYRLQAREMPSLTMYPDSALKGSIIHQALAYCWQQLKTSEGLNAMPLDSLVSRSVYRSLKQWQSRYPFYLSSSVFTLEYQRIQKLIMTWLTLEKQRPPFRVLGYEKTYQVTVKKLTISLRIDRVDQLEGGEVLVLDYKTGVVNMADWFKGRLIEPQLPLYVFATQASAAAFASLRAGDTKLIGIASHAVTLPGLASVAGSRHSQFDQWSELVSHWRQQLDDLALEFQCGCADVNPFSAQAACQFCDLSSLCRVQDSTR